MLTPSQKALLRELSMDPNFAAILEFADAKIKRDHRYRPDDEPEDKKTAEWHFYSGVDRGVTDVIRLLTYEQRN